MKKRLLVIELGGAPTLPVLPSCPTMARAISPDIEIYRFDSNEDWRAGVRVMRRRRVNDL